MSKNTIANGQGDSALEMLSNVATSPATCIHGHNNCSDRIGGECSDEMLSRLDRDNDGEPLTIDLTPSWSALIPFMVAVLRNPEASEEAVKTIEGELMRLAQHVDKLQS